MPVTPPRWARPAPDITGADPPAGRPHAFQWISALIASGIVVQFLLGGIGVFGAGGYEGHIALGWALHTLSMVEFVVAVVRPRTKQAIGGSAALLVGLTVQVSLPGMRNDAPWLAAFHPLLALAVLLVAARMGAPVLRTVLPRRSGTRSSTFGIGSG